MTNDEKARKTRLKRKIKELKDRHLSGDQLLKEAAEWYVNAIDMFLIATERPPFTGEEPDAANVQDAIRGYIAERGRAANLKRRKQDKAHQAMVKVFSSWTRWQRYPIQYPSQAEFARAMQREHPALQNIDSIKNAIYRWKKTPHEVRDGVVVKKEQSN